MYTRFICCENTVYCFSVPIFLRGCILFTTIYVRAPSIYKKYYPLFSAAMNGYLPSNDEKRQKEKTTELNNCGMYIIILYLLLYYINNILFKNKICFLSFCLHIKQNLTLLNPSIDMLYGVYSSWLRY